MSLNRLYAILIKDLYWMLSNIKIASLLVAPLVISILISSVGGMFSSVSYTFTMSFVGIFITSLSVTEEKKNDTLFSLLASPLNGSEFVFGKIMTSVILCLLFCFTSALINDSIRDFYNIYFLLNLVLFSFITSCLGCFLGLFCKNEQVLSVIVTPLMMLFAMGTFFSELLFTDIKSSFLPDYHFVKIVNLADTKSAISHTLLNIFASFLYYYITVSYVNFYFKYGREKVLNKKITAKMLLLIVPSLLSGYFFITEKSKHNDIITSQSNVNIKTMIWNLSFQQSEYSAKLLVRNSFMTKYELTIKNSDTEIEILIRPPKKFIEKDQKARKLRVKKRIGIISYETITISNHEFDKWIQSTKDIMTMVYELYHKDEILIISIDLKATDISNLHEMKKELEAFISKANIKLTSPK